MMVDMVLWEIVNTNFFKKFKVFASALHFAFFRLLRVSLGILFFLIAFVNLHSFFDSDLIVLFGKILIVTLGAVWLVKEVKKTISEVMVKPRDPSCNDMDLIERRYRGRK